MLLFLPLVGELKNDAMRDRHWDIMCKLVGTDFKIDESLISGVENINYLKWDGV